MPRKIADVQPPEITPELLQEAKAVFIREKEWVEPYTKAYQNKDFKKKIKQLYQAITKLKNCWENFGEEERLFFLSCVVSDNGLPFFCAKKPSEYGDTLHFPDAPEEFDSRLEHVLSDHDEFKNYIARYVNHRPEQTAAEKS